MDQKQMEHHPESEQKLIEELRSWKTEPTMPKVLMNEHGDQHEYNTDRKICNTRFDRWPLAIVLCETEAHVLATLKLSQKYNWELKVRSGGHDHEGFCTADNAIVIDLRKMNHVKHNDKEELILRVQPGIPFEKLVLILDKLNICIPHGTCGTVNVAGFTLGGGWGPWTRIQGMCVEHLIGARMVLKTGEVIEVTNESTDERSRDLLWALRGGGGVSCGIVTEFIFKAFKMPPNTIKFNLVWQGKPAMKVLEMWENIVEPAKNSCLIGTNLMISAMNPEDVSPDPFLAEADCTFFGYYAGTYQEMVASIHEWFHEMPATEINIPLGPIPRRLAEKKLLTAAGHAPQDLVTDGVSDDLFDEKLIEAIEQHNNSGLLSATGIGSLKHNIQLADSIFSIFRTWDMPVATGTVTTKSGRKLGYIPPDYDAPSPHKITSKVMKWLGNVDGATNGDQQNGLQNDRVRARINIIKSLQSKLIPRNSQKAGEDGYNKCNVLCYATLGAITGPYYSEHKNFPDSIGCAMPYRHNFYTVQYQAWWNNNCYPEFEWPIEWIANCREYDFPETEGAFISFRDKDVPYSTYFMENYSRLKKIMDKYMI